MPRRGSKRARAPDTVTPNPQVQLNSAALYHFIQSFADDMMFLDPGLLSAWEHVFQEEQEEEGAIPLHFNIPAGLNHLRLPLNGLHLPFRSFSLRINREVVGVDHHEQGCIDVDAALPFSRISPGDPHCGVICCICQESMRVRQHVRCSPACQHAFHKKCIDRWLQRATTCPMCRENLLEF